MMAVVVRALPEQEELKDFDARLLQPVEISYYSVDGNGLVMHGACNTLVPRDTNFAVLERMLSLWSLGNNREET
jgi:hypothetical protein